MKALTGKPDIEKKAKLPPLPSRSISLTSLGLGLAANNNKKDKKKRDAEKAMFSSKIEDVH